jgi:hypothetical protein
VNRLVHVVAGAALLAWAGAAAAAPRLAVGPIGGAASPALVRQVGRALCGPSACLSYAKVSTRGEPDLGKARLWWVKGIVTGRVARQGARAVLTLTLLRPREDGALQWRVRVARSGLAPAGAMERVAVEVAEVLTANASSTVAPLATAPSPQPSAPSARSLAVASEPPVPAIEVGGSAPDTPAPSPALPRPSPGEGDPPPTSRTPSSYPTPTPTSISTPSSTAAPLTTAPSPQPSPPLRGGGGELLTSPTPRPPPTVFVRRPIVPVPLPPPPVLGARRGPREPWFVLDLAAFAARRELRYAGAVAGPAPLRELTAPLVAGPDLRVELAPAAAFGGGGAAARAALVVRYARSVGLTTATDTGEQRPTDLTRLSLGASWRTAPVSAARVVVTPSLAYRSERLAVRPALPGLADQALAGIEARIGVEVRPAERLTVLAAAGYVHWTAAGGLLGDSEALFTAGSAFGLEAEAGLDVRVAGPVSLRLVGEYGTTRYALEPDPSGLRSASGARDTSLGGRLGLRIAL